MSSALSFIAGCFLGYLGCYGIAILVGKLAGTIKRIRNALARVGGA